MRLVYAANAWRFGFNVMQESRGVYIAEGANECWNANYPTVSL